MRLSFLLLCLLLTPGCTDLCASGDSPTLELGSGVGGAFEPYVDGQVVTLDVAPQGGFGVTTLIATTGLLAGDSELAAAQLDVRIGGNLEGSFLAEDTRLLCADPAEGGRMSGVVVGFDPAVYSTNDDLLDLDGQTVLLDVTVTDSAGNTANAQRDVVVSVGN